MRHDERGATAVEYAIMVTLISVALLAAIAGIGTELVEMFSLAMAAFGT